MYAVLCNPIFWNEINEVISSKGEEILFKNIDTDIDIVSEFEKVGRIFIRHFIIDISTIQDQDTRKLITCIKRYRIKNDKTQIIIIAPNVEPPNQTINTLVGMGIYDILNPKAEKLEDILLTPLLTKVLEEPATYKKAVRWVLDDEEEEENSSKNDKAEKKSIKKVEKIVEVEVEKVVEVEVLQNNVISLVSNAATGKSFLAWTLGEAFSKKNYTTTIINIDKGCSMCAYFPIEDEDIKDLKKHLRSDDYTNILDHAYKVNKNLNVITGGLGQENYLDLKKFNRVLNVVRAKSDIVIIDSKTGLDEIAKNAISQSNINLLVFDLNAFHYNMNFKMLEEMQKEKLFIPEKFIAVINNVIDCNSYKKTEKSLDDIGCDFKEIVTVKNAGGSAYDLMFEGVSPYSKNEEFKNSVEAVLNVLRAKKQNKGILGKLFGKLKK